MSDGEVEISGNSNKEKLKNEVNNERLKSNTTTTKISTNTAGSKKKKKKKEREKEKEKMNNYVTYSESYNKNNNEYYNESNNGKSDGKISGKGYRNNCSKNKDLINDKEMPELMELNMDIKFSQFDGKNLKRNINNKLGNLIEDNNFITKNKKENLNRDKKKKINNNRKENLSKSLHRVPVGFIKAKENYDPNILLHKTICENSKIKDENLNDNNCSIINESELSSSEKPLKVGNLPHFIIRETEEGDEEKRAKKKKKKDVNTKNINLKDSQFSNSKKYKHDLLDFFTDEVANSNIKPEDVPLIPLFMHEKNIDDNKLCNEDNNEINFDITSSNNQEEKKKDLDYDKIEYGFLPEDYEFDISQINISNVRYGITNQYYTSCIDLTGSMDKYMWIDEADIYDYLFLKGVKEYRLSSFMNYITKGIGIENGEYSEEVDSDIYISGSSQSKFSDLDISSTESLKAKGKGKMKQLNIDDMKFDNVLYESLKDQYRIYCQYKKSKKDLKDKFNMDNDLNKDDLLIKYPYSLHIEEICNEFNNFLIDNLRTTLNFPPLDFHGNKTIKRISDCYNMLSTQYGCEKKSFIRVSKTRKMYKKLPRFDEINKIMRQRKFFKRTDQKKPKDETTIIYAKSKKDKIKGKNKASAHFHKEGDIVGGSAPEIDVNNIGRKLLEKLGWIRGEGLGKHGNKGISKPIAATIKISKTGLK